MSDRIPLNRLTVLGREEAYLAAAVKGGRLAGGGDFSARCEALLERQLGAARVLLTPSCTAALEMAALLLDLQPGDEVVMPSFTFVSTANAFCLRGAIPRFVDIRPDTLNLDEQQVEDVVNARTRAIVPVHYGGVACDMEALVAIAGRHGLAIVEDAAQAIGASYRGRPLGAIGEFGTFSFHESKNLGCGEGGALVLRDPDMIDAAEILREKGTDRSAFFAGRVDKYTWRAFGSSFLPSELNAAFLLGQLEKQEQAAAARRRLYARYVENLRPLAEQGHFRHQAEPEGCRGNQHVMAVLCNDHAARDGLMRHLQARDIGATFHYVPLHTAPVGLNFGYRKGMLPVTEELSERLLRLPLFASLGDTQVDAVCETVSEYFAATDAT